MTDDIELLERFAARGDESAFRALVGTAIAPQSMTALTNRTDLADGACLIRCGQ